MQTEGEVAEDFRIRAMHDVTEGGVEGAIWEMAQALGVGMCIEKDAIPVLYSTKALAKIADIDLYRLISSGSMLVVMDQDDFEPMRKELEERSILFTKIGEIAGDSRVIYKNEEGEEAIPSPGPDELYSALLKLQ